MTVPFVPNNLIIKSYLNGDPSDSMNVLRNIRFNIGCILDKPMESILYKISRT